jgi:hypothetical protein
MSGKFQEILVWPTKGLDFFSKPILVLGPCPENITVASGKVNNWVVIFSNNKEWFPPGKSVLPMLP